MKKLMIAAAAAAMVGGAFAACQEDTDCVFAYKIVLSGKTTVAQTYKGNASKCIEGACYRKPGSFKYAGYVWGTTEDISDPSECVEGCSCNDFGNFNTDIWDNKTKLNAEVGNLTFDQLDLITKDANKVEAVASLAGLKLAGFGTYNTSKKLLKTITGNFAGQLAAPKCTACTYDASECKDTCEETDSVVFALCTLAKEEVATTAAYGTWSFKYDSSAVKKLTKNYSYEAIAPAKYIPAN